MQVRSYANVISLALLGALGCSRPQRAVLDEPLARKALTTYADIARAAYADSVTSAQQLRSAIDALLAEPSDATLQGAREAWRAARRPYLQTEVYRFYEGPIDRVELLVNTWPIDENYVEAVPDAGDKGVIDDFARYPTLAQQLLVTLNARDGETSISTGYHVIEFLLWGRDESADGPGTRPASDFAPGDPLRDRRRTYLALATDLLIQHLSEVAAAWRDSYGAQFLALPPRQALALIMRGMGSLSGPELAGERLTVPYETRDQENEHSCFSDTTHEDVALDALGIENVCLGRYRALDGKEVRGTGVCAIFDEASPELGRTLSQQIGASVDAAKRLPAPFDRALTMADDSDERRAIKRTIDALQVQTETIARAAAALGIVAQEATP